MATLIVANWDGIWGMNDLTDSNLKDNAVCRIYCT